MLQTNTQNNTHKKYTRIIECKPNYDYKITQSNLQLQ